MINVGYSFISKNSAKYELNAFKNKFVNYFFKIIFLDYSSTIYFFPFRNVKRRSLGCQEVVNGMLGEGKKRGIINRTLIYDEF